MGENLNSINISENTNYILLRNNNLPYIWNMTDKQEEGYYSKDNTKYNNNISNLKTSLTETTLKAYGTVNKYISSGSITKGTAVRYTNKLVNDVNTLCIETYTQITSVSEDKKGAAFLGVALNDANDGGYVYVCIKGITTIKLGNTVLILIVVLMVFWHLQVKMVK